MRVASLLPSATEIVCALGLRDALVGVSHECDWPRGVEGLPALTSTRLATGPNSATIDRDLRALVADALAVYTVDVEALERAAPDVIVTQDLCAVCAVSYDAVCEATAQLTSGSPTIVSLHPTRLEHIWRDVRQVAEALGAQAQGEALLESLDARVAAVRERVAGADSRPRTLTIEWLDPVMIGGTWMPELVTLAGGQPLVTAPGEHAPTLDPRALAQLDPEVVVIKPCGFELPRTRQELPQLRTLLEGLEWSALETGRVFLADGHAYFNRPGPRIVDSLEILAHCLHPERCPLPDSLAAGVERLG